MPTYEFHCKCGKKTEQFHSFGKAPRDIKCECGLVAEKMVKCPSSIRFVGDGFNSSYRSKMDEESESIMKHGMEHWNQGMHKKYVTEDKSIKSDELFGHDTCQGEKLLQSEK